MEQVGAAHGAGWLLCDGEIALDAGVAKNVAARRDGVALADALGRLGANVDLADGAGWVGTVGVVGHGGVLEGRGVVLAVGYDGVRFRLATRGFG